MKLGSGHYEYTESRVIHFKNGWTSRVPGMRVSLFSFKARRARNRERGEKKVREAEMPSIASGMAAGGEGS